MTVLCRTVVHMHLFTEVCEGAHAIENPLTTVAAWTDEG